MIRKLLCKLACLLRLKKCDKRCEVKKCPVTCQVGKCTRDEVKPVEKKTKTKRKPKKV